MATVRQAVDGDIPRLQELYAQLSLIPGEYPAATLDECRRVMANMAATPGYTLLVVEENGAVVGTAVLAVLPAFAHKTSSFAVVEYVVVDESCRSRGIGRRLMNHCVAKAKETGCYKVVLTSDNRREDAHRFYRSLGFEASAQGFRLYFP
jgi:GNAT superfamily N-acetyltransferase